MTNCFNCETCLVGNFCENCGQKVVQARVNSEGKITEEAILQEINNLMKAFIGS